ncbi:MAG: hypothetical protein KAW41_06640 [Candidatus Diapherotrites archaeon]|nr:hypothetical protein [Candidatus Diapherotrites archaeon]
MELEHLKQERDKLNTETQKLRTESKETTSRVKRLRLSLKDAKAKRDEENKLVQEFKQKRDEVNKKIKAHISALNKFQEDLAKLKASSGPMHQTRKELERLEWKVQTEVLDVKQEEKIARRIAELEEACAASAEFNEKRKQLRKITSELDDLRKEAQAYHEVMLQHAKDSERYHDDVKKAYEQIKKLEPEFKEVQQKVALARREADEAHKTYLDKYKSIKGAEKFEQEKVHKKKARAMRAEANDLMKAFKEGKKLTTDELMIIQGYGGSK